MMWVRLMLFGCGWGCIALLAIQRALGVTAGRWSIVLLMLACFGAVILSAW